VNDKASTIEHSWQSSAWAAFGPLTMTDEVVLP
jgi:hypothetical protein